MQFLCECVKIDCETDCDARGAPAKILPRAPNYSGLALEDMTVNDKSTYDMMGGKYHSVISSIKKA